MPVVSTKHKDREQTFSFRNFNGGYNQDIAAPFLAINELSRCKNLKYVSSVDGQGNPVVTLKKRQGTELVSTAAISAAVQACFYYVNQAQYIVATTAKLYYLDASFAPVEIGNIDGLPTFTEFHDKLIIHDSGITKAWNGTTLETLACWYEDEIIETGNGATVDFTGTLAHPQIVPGSLTITFTDTTIKTITDNGAGALTGNVAADTNTVTYTTGAYSFKCDGAPDASTNITATYNKVEGAPKSEWGFVRASRLKMGGDPDNQSRLWYSGSNDEYGWDSSSSGGYLDVDPDDGHELLGGLNFFDSILLFKSQSLHRLENFPGDSVFRVVPLLAGTGAKAYRTILNDGEFISFLSQAGWQALAASQRFGDIQQTTLLSKKFSQTCSKYLSASAYSAFNQIDAQLWLTLYDDDQSSYFPYIFVINIGTGGQLSLYQFAFGHSCYAFVNGEMLIGGSDGNLYRLLAGDTRFRDNGVSYTGETFLRSSFTNCGLPFHLKHNKKWNLAVNANVGGTATLKLYKDRSYADFESTSINLPSGDILAYDLQEVKAYDMTAPVASGRIDYTKDRFNYHDLMFELSDIEGALGFEIFGMDTINAVIGGS